MASNNLFNILMITMFFLSSVTFCTSERLITKMIHYRSIHSPYYNASHTVEELWRREIENFKARMNQLSTGSDYYESKKAIEATVVAKPLEPVFMVELMIGGESPISQLVVMDTGSSVLWLRCDIGTSSSSFSSGYNPTMSSTFKEVACGSHSCSYYSGDSCIGNRLCAYHLHYNSGDMDVILATETFKFATERTESEISDLVFGCALDMEKKLISNEVNGIMGLGTDHLSLLTQKLYPQFSYCIGNLSDPTYTENVLIINDDPIPDSQPTSLLIHRYHYGAKLERIDVGGKFLDRTMPVDESFTIFDTGAGISLLTEAVYPEFEDAVIKLIGSHLGRSNWPPIDKDRICYVGDLHRDLSWFPSVSFHFQQGLKMEFTYQHLFLQSNSDIVCLGVENAGNHNVYGSLIGANLQQYFYVYYNIMRRNLRIKKLDCEVLYD